MRQYLVDSGVPAGKLDTVSFGEAKPAVQGHDESAWKWNRRAEFVAVFLEDGELGIAPGHTPLVGRLGFGEMRAGAGEEVERFYVEGGFVEVAGDVVTVLTPYALPAAEIDAPVARQRLVEALARRATSEELLARRDAVVAQNRAQLRVARRAE